MEFNPDAILEELNEFEKREQEVTPRLDEYLQRIAKTGNIMLPWSKLKPLLKRKMDLVITEFCKNSPPDAIPSYPNTDKFEYERLKANILEAVDFFPNAPFTIQRLCELITDPKKHYNRTDKYMRGLEKNLLVVSTVGPNEADESSDREPASANDWVNSDSSGEAHNFPNAATNVPGTNPSVNGTVLENFATVFPSATRIVNKANSIQVSIVTDRIPYPIAEAVGDLEYEVIDNSALQEREMHYDNNNDSSEGIKVVIAPIDVDSEPGQELINKKVTTTEENTQSFVRQETKGEIILSEVTKVEGFEMIDNVDSGKSSLTCSKHGISLDESDNTESPYQTSSRNDEITFKNACGLQKDSEKADDVVSDSNVKANTEVMPSSGENDCSSEPIAKRRKCENVGDLEECAEHSSLMGQETKSTSEVVSGDSEVVLDDSEVASVDSEVTLGETIPTFKPSSDSKSLSDDGMMIIQSNTDKLFEQSTATEPLPTTGN